MIRCPDRRPGAAEQANRAIDMPDTVWPNIFEIGAFGAGSHGSQYCFQCSEPKSSVITLNPASCGQFKTGHIRRLVNAACKALSAMHRQTEGHRGTLSLPQRIACPRHRDLADSSCSANHQLLRWSRPVLLKCSCGATLTIESLSARHASAPGSRLLLRKITGSRIDEKPRIRLLAFMRLSDH